MTYLNHRGTYEENDVHEASTPSPRCNHGLDSESRFDGRSGLCVVGLLDVAATVIVAGSPARERFACQRTRLTLMSFSILPVLNANEENVNAN